jgi:predicted peptidase
MRRQFCGTLLLVLLPALPIFSQTQETGFLNRTLALRGESYRYQVFVPADYTPTRRWPVVLFLHGGGERGVDGLLPTETGLGSAIRRYSDRYPAVVVFPQGRVGALWGELEASVALGALAQTEREFATDPDRVYLTGLSRGGEAAYYLAYRDPSRFAALLVSCGRVRPGAPPLGRGVPEPVVPPADGEPFVVLAKRLQRLPVWVFHGDADTAISVEESRLLRDALGPNSATFTYTELAGVGHNAWDAMYRSPAVAEWLFRQRRSQAR